MVEISALMSVYNGEKYVATTIDTILNQTFQDFELIIVNDGSNDKTQEILESYKDPRIKLYNFSENKGVGAALQFGLKKTQGGVSILV
ncbi:MAG TPA: glycosyltransferase family 2 protein [Defluviitaleaceae bacterium]|nr:glycosyltransferase family 2 protein [Defluviitaleaceae bacterium]